MVPDSKPKVLEIKGITKKFGDLSANNSVDLELFQGEIHGLLGENGAGKSTLMNILYGLYQPNQGEIHVRGRREIIKSPLEAIDLGIGMVHQHFMLTQPHTVTENILLGLNQKDFFCHLIRPKKRLWIYQKNMGFR